MMQIQKHCISLIQLRECIFNTFNLILVTGKDEITLALDYLPEITRMIKKKLGEKK